MPKNNSKTPAYQFEDPTAGKDYSIKAGERIAQLVLVNTYGVDFKVVDSLPETDRSSGGFGSTD